LNDIKNYTFLSCRDNRCRKRLTKLPLKVKQTVSFCNRLKFNQWKIGEIDSCLRFLNNIFYFKMFILFFTAIRIMSSRVFFFLGEVKENRRMYTNKLIRLYAYVRVVCFVSACPHIYVRNDWGYDLLCIKAVMFVRTCHYKPQLRMSKFFSGWTFPRWEMTLRASSALRPLPRGTLRYRMSVSCYSNYIL